MRSTLLFALIGCTAMLVKGQQYFNCDSDPKSCGSVLKCDPCSDCYVNCNAPGACKGKTVVCPGDHVCTIHCGFYNKDFPEDTDACAGMKVYNPTAPKAGPKSCLPPGVTYANFRAYCGAPGACANMTIANTCSYGNCDMFACDAYNPHIADCKNEIGGLSCTGTGCPPP